MCTLRILFFALQQTRINVYETQQKRLKWNISQKINMARVNWYNFIHSFWNCKFLLSKWIFGVVDREGDVNVVIGECSLHLFLCFSLLDKQWRFDVGPARNISCVSFDINMNTGLPGDSTYDFSSEENSAKWKGLLTTALKKVSWRTFCFDLSDLENGDQFENICYLEMSKSKQMNYFLIGVDLLWNCLHIFLDHLLNVWIIFLLVFTYFYRIVLILTHWK